MRETYLSILFSPMTLLILINAFFMIFTTSFVWNRFLNLNFVRDEVGHSSLQQHPVLLKVTFLVPVVAIVPILLFGKQHHLIRNLLKLLFCFSLFVIMMLWVINFLYYALLNANLLSSIVMYHFSAALIAFSVLMGLSKTDKNNSATHVGAVGCLLAYFCMLYLFYLIVLMGTIITSLNTLSSHITNPRIWGVLFLIQFVFIFTVISMKQKGKLLWFVGYVTMASLMIWLRN